MEKDLVEFIEKFKQLKNDGDKYILTKDNQHLDLKIEIDNDAVFIYIEDFDEILNFDEFGYYALCEALIALGINADMV